MHRLPALLLIVAAIIHLLPLPGVFGAAPLARLYGVTVSDPNLLILLQHRAVLFALLALLFITAAWRPEWRTLACVMGLASTMSFLLVAQIQGGYNAQIGRVVVADVIAIVCLAGAWTLDMWLGGRARMA
jgi:hypothetical protein